MKKPKVIVVICGVTSGLTAGCFQGGKYQSLLKANLPFAENENGIKYWPMDWLNAVLQTVSSGYAISGDIVACATWGADYAPIATDRIGRSLRVLPAQFYGSVPREFLDQATKVIDPLEIYLGTGGANVKWFQMLSQLFCDLQHRGDLLRSDQVIGFVPMADIITSLLSGKQGHDKTMLQSYGLLGPGSREIYARLFGEEFAKKIAPWEMFAEDGLLEGPGGIRICPTTHDSVPSRDIGFMLCDDNDWTGTWVGGAKKRKAYPNVQPSAASFTADIAFEGIGDSAAAITNIDMFGSLWEALKKKAGWPDYATAAAKALPLLEAMEVRETLSRNPAPKGEGILPYLETAFGSDWALQAAGLITIAAEACKKSFDDTAALFGTPPPTKVAFTGGWVNNPAFLAKMQMLGIELVIPPLAAEATHAGVAAKALIRAGEAANLQEALELLRAA